MADQNPDSVSVDLSGIINLPTATESQDGLVELADAAETQAGVDNTQAVTPAAAAATYIPLSALSAKGDLLTLSGCNMRVALRVGADGQVLTACSSSVTGLRWTSLPAPPPPSIPCACLTGKGTLIAAYAPGIPSALPLGTNGQVLTVNSDAETGLCWATPPSPAIPCSCIVGKGALIAGTSTGTPSALPVGSDGQVLVACGSATTGLCWLTVPTPFIPCSAIPGKGSIITGSSFATPTALPVGSDGQVLHANSACPAGLEWKNPSGGGSNSVCALANPGIVAVTMGNLRICFNSAGNRTWAFATVSGTSTAIAQVTTASNTALATERRVTTLNSTTFCELGGNFVCAGSCATYLICLGPLNNPNAIYCFVGMTGCNYISNFFNLTRLF